MSMLSNEERTELRRLLVERFTLSELKDLAFDLGVAYEVFKHDTLADFARELMLFCERQGQVSCLLSEIRRCRPDHEQLLATLLAKLPPCAIEQKIQIIIAETLLERMQVLLEGLARELGIPVEAITVVGAAWGSTRLLLGLPTAAINFTRFKHISTLANGRYHVLSIEAFTFMSFDIQKTWRLIATAHPPLYADGTLYAAISWQAAQLLAGGQKMTTAFSPSTPPLTHWLSRTDNQSQLLAISRELVGKLSPGETNRLESLFPRYAQLAQMGQVKTVQQVQREFGLSGDVASLAIVVLSVLFTAINAWIEQQNRQTLTELKLRQEADRTLLYRLLDDALKRNHIVKDERERLRPYLAEAVAREIGDPYSGYERGLEKLNELLGQNLELLTYEQQLRENIGQTRRYGDTFERTSRRSEVIEQLNRFSLQMLGQSFNDLCQIGVTEDRAGQTKEKKE